VSDLFVAQFFGCSKQTIAGIVDDDIDPAEVSKGFVHNSSNRCQIRHVQKGKPQKIAMLCLEISHCFHPANGTRDTVAAGKKLFCHFATEAAIYAGDQPRFLCHSESPSYASNLLGLFKTKHRLRYSDIFVVSSMTYFP